MNEKIKQFFKRFFIISGIIIAELFIIFLYASYGRYLANKTQGTDSSKNPSIESTIEQLTDRIEQQRNIISTALTESDKIRQDYKITKKHLEQAEKTIYNLTFQNQELIDLNKQAADEIRISQQLIEAIGTNNINATTIIIELKRINQELADSIEDL